MFGYISPRLDLLSEEQRVRYRAAYCGLCRALGELSGYSGKLLLSHDMTFLSILLRSLTEETYAEENRRCLLHPIRSRPFIRSRAVEYSAAMNLILMHFKCMDQIRDGEPGAAGIMERRLHSSLKKVSDAYPEKFQTIGEILESLWQEEKKEVPNPDRLCNLSGEMLGTAFTPEWLDPYWKSTIYRLGCGLGRFVYWMDAWEDQKQDFRKGNYNPLTEYRKEPDADLFVKEVMEMMMGEAASFFEALPLEKDLDLLRNVLYSGVWQKYDLKHKNAGKERS